MSVFRNNYETVVDFCKDVVKNIDNLLTRVTNLEHLSDEAGGGFVPQDEEDVEEQEIEPYVYDGPFAVSVDHADAETPTTLYVAVNGGGITVDGTRWTDNGYKPTAGTSTKAIASGQSIWISLPYSYGASHSYIIDSSNHNDVSYRFYVKLAENVNGELKQVHFGDIYYTKKAPVTSVNAGSSNVSVSPTTGNVYVSVTGGGGSGGMGFPDWAALNGGSGGTVIPNSYSSSSSSSNYGSSSLTTVTANSDGWLRMSIRNDYGYNPGDENACIKLYLGGVYVSTATLGMFQFRHGSGGLTYIIPIQQGTTMAYSAAGGQTYVIFAPSIGSGVPFPNYANLASGGSGYTLSSGGKYQAQGNGWLRVSVYGGWSGCFTMKFNDVSIGLFQGVSGAGGATLHFPIQANTTIEYTNPSGCSSLVKFDGGMTVVTAPPSSD